MADVAKGGVIGVLDDGSWLVDCSLLLRRLVKWLNGSLAVWLRFLTAGWIASWVFGWLLGWLFG